MVCRPPGALECVTTVVSGQCGEEIASATRTLGSRLLAELNCTGRKRQLICLLEYICCASAFIVVTVVTDHFIYLFNMKFVQQYTAKTLVKKTQKTMEESTTSY